MDSSSRVLKKAKHCSALRKEDKERSQPNVFFFQLGVISLICGFTVVRVFLGAVERQPVVLYHANIKQKQ